MNKIIEEHINNITGYINALETKDIQALENHKRNFVQTFRQTLQLLQNKKLKREEIDTFNKYLKLSTDLYENITVLENVGRKKYNDSYFIETLKLLNGINTKQVETQEKLTGLPLGYEEDMLQLFENKNNIRNGR